jgi:hypothetical protein
MLEHQKIVIQNLTHDKSLFVNELRKSKKWLNAVELSELEQWVKENFWNTHQNEIEEAFNQNYYLA